MSTLDETNLAGGKNTPPLLLQLKVPNKNTNATFISDQSKSNPLFPLPAEGFATTTGLGLKKSSPKQGFFGFFTSHFKSKPKISSTSIACGESQGAQPPPPSLHTAHRGSSSSNGESQVNIGGLVASTVPPPAATIVARDPSENWNFVKKLAKVKKFIDSIKTSSLHESFYKIQMPHLLLISDKADFSVMTLAAA